MSRALAPKVMSVDYFDRFFTSEGLDFTGLLNADFFEPVRILYKAEHYVSAAKLLVVAIDSVSYVEYGEAERKPFVAWLTQYAQLNTIGVSAEELWEHRNSLLHMSNLDSRRVRAGKVRRLIAYIGKLPPDISIDDDTTGYYDLQKLIIEFGHACERWCMTYNTDRSKIEKFVERYDLIASDARMLWVKV